MKKILIVLIVLVALIFLFFVGVGLGLYVFRWSFVQPVTKIIPYPVAYVDGQFISYNTWQKYLNDLTWQYERAKELQIANVEILSDDELAKKSLDFLVDKTILEKLAKERGITVNEEEVSQYFSEEILPQANNNEEEIKTTLKELFNWTISDFKDKVLKEYLLRKKVQTSFGEEDLEAKIKALKDELTVIKFIK